MRGYAVFERVVARVLDSDTVRQGVGKRNAQFDDVTTIIRKQPNRVISFNRSAGEVFVQSTGKFCGAIDRMRRLKSGDDTLRAA